MSFEANDMNTIHRGNYEEFFILYMDNELNDEQIKMVDAFLTAHPDLKAEFEILQGTKLPMEEFSFDKKELLAENMKLASIDEELLLYIDNELSDYRKNIVELEIASNTNYQLQVQTLLRAKLDSSEKIEYSNKKELYRRTEKVIAFKVWMRVAAAIVIFAIAGLFYFRNSSHTVISTTPPIANVVKKNPVVLNGEGKKEPVYSNTASSDNINNDKIAVDQSSEKLTHSGAEKVKTLHENPTPQIAIALPQQQTEETLERPTVKNVQLDGTERTIALADPKTTINTINTINTNHVTSSSLERNINETSIDQNQSIAGNDHKGSIKGFLRKATRMIEKRTGIDPTNANGELLIGAVAINLK